ncbi:hypothetical protein WJX74_000520 [Apatococcus lobatus]|uniref:HhH-GPD domain-containing protein n=1 Tax=Apatococcus lobatus TaxID=904363 RepID=A0AAW1S9U0_9CHLO
MRTSVRLLRSSKRAAEVDKPQVTSVTETKVTRITPRKRQRRSAQERHEQPQPQLAAQATPQRTARLKPAPDVSPVSLSKTTKKPSRKTPKRLRETLISIDNLPAIKTKAARIASILDGLYDDPPCPLNYETPFQLLVAVILSAQSTDKKVNEITPALFRDAADAPAMAQLPVERLQAHIKQLGLAPTKAKNISAMSKMLMEQHGAQVPDTFEALEALPGVGHKTASCVLAIAFKQATFPVDTHIHRLAMRWGLSQGPSVEQAEADLKACFEESTWNSAYHPCNRSGIARTMWLLGGSVDIVFQNRRQEGNGNSATSMRLPRICLCIRDIPTLQDAKCHWASQVQQPFQMLTSS